jgi:serine/threonine protein kinase
VQYRCRRRALKISPPSASWEASEQHILARLDHPYIVKFLGASCDAFKNYLVLEASMAGDLYALLRVQQALLSEGQARVLIACLASAIGYVHEVGLVYRDLKPENVLLDARAHVRLVDFRLALIGTDWSL